MASVASQLVEAVTAHAQRDSLEDAWEIWADGTYFPNNLIILKITHSKSTSEGVNVSELYQCKVQQQIFKFRGSISKESVSQVEKLNDFSPKETLEFLLWTG